MVSSLARFKKQVYEGRHDALVSGEVFARVQEVIAAQSTGERKRAYDHHLKGSLFCGRCFDTDGTPSWMIMANVRGRSGGEYQYFFCRRCQEHLCNAPYIQLPRLEDARVRFWQRQGVTEAFSEALRAGTHQAVEKDQRATRSLHKQVNANLKKLDTQEQNLLDLAADGLIPRATIQIRVSAITKQRATMTAQLENVERKLADILDYIDAAVSFLERPGEVYAHATDEIRRLMNQAMFRRIYVEADEVTGVDLNAPFDALLAADAAFQQQSTPADGKGASMSEESREILDIALDDISSKRNMVGLVQWYSKYSGRTTHLRKLASTKPDQRRPIQQRRVPRKARQLTGLEKMAFVEGYERGEQIADLALRLGVHRTTLDNLVRRLELTRQDPNSVPPSVRDDIVASYRSGETLAVIGRRHGFSPNKVQRLLFTVGQPIRARGPRRTPVTSEQLQEMVGRYEEGEAIAAVAEMAGVSYAHARGCLIDAGVQLRPRGGAR